MTGSRQRSAVLRPTRPAYRSVPLSFLRCIIGRTPPASQRVPACRKAPSRPGTEERWRQSWPPDRKREQGPCQRGPEDAACLLGALGQGVRRTQTVAIDQGRYDRHRRRIVERIERAQARRNDVHVPDPGRIRQDQRRKRANSNTRPTLAHIMISTGEDRSLRTPPRGIRMAPGTEATASTGQAPHQIPRRVVRATSGLRGRPDPPASKVPPQPTTAGRTALQGLPEGQAPAIASARRENPTRCRRSSSKNLVLC